jgi:hypothetical protein
MLSNFLCCSTFLVAGVRVFAREGTSYYHSFNVSLLGGTVQCEETYEIDPGSPILSTRGHEIVEAAVCRSTALPLRAAANTTEQIVYVSPLA